MAFQKGQTMKLFIKLLFIAIAGTVGVQAQTQTAPETLIKNATVLSVTRGTLTNTDVLLRSGKIAAVGKNLSASANARIIDGAGKFVLPGIIDAHSHSMLDTINEGTLAVTSMVRTEDVMNSNDVDLDRAPAGHAA
jgi:predicted amidohydrolase YtcJ